MVVGNGFFSDTEDQARVEMQRRSKCDVRYLPLECTGVTYYVSENGDIYGLQHIANRCITRTKKPALNGKRLCARNSLVKNKETWIPMEQVVWNAFNNYKWAEQPLIHIDGNPNNYKLSNLRLAKRKIPEAWTTRMSDMQNVYKNFQDVCEYIHCNLPDVPIEDAKDIAQNAFIYLTTEGHKKENGESDFLKLWKKICRLRAVDYIKHRFMNVYDPLALKRLHSNYHADTYETDLTPLLPGKRSRQYLRLWMEGYTPTEIAEITDSTYSSVSSANCRSIQFLRRYIKQYGKRYI